MGDIGFDSGFCNSGFSVQDDKTTQKLVVGNCGNTGAVSEQREHTACPGGSMRVEESSLEEGSLFLPWGLSAPEAGGVTECLQVSITLNCRNLGVTVFTFNSVASMPKW